MKHTGVDVLLFYDAFLKFKTWYLHDIYEINKYSNWTNNALKNRCILLIM